MIEIRRKHFNLQLKVIVYRKTNLQINQSIIKHKIINLIHNTQLQIFRQIFYIYSSIQSTFIIHSFIKITIKSLD